MKRFIALILLSIYTNYCDTMNKDTVKSAGGTHISDDTDDSTASLIQVISRVSTSLAGLIKLEELPTEIIAFNQGRGSWSRAAIKLINIDALLERLDITPSQSLKDDIEKIRRYVIRHVSQKQSGLNFYVALIPPNLRDQLRGLTVGTLGLICLLSTANMIIPGMPELINMMLTSPGLSAYAAAGSGLALYVIYRQLKNEYSYSNLILHTLAPTINAVTANLIHAMHAAHDERMIRTIHAHTSAFSGFIQPAQAAQNELQSWDAFIASLSDEQKDLLPDVAGYEEKPLDLNEHLDFILSLTDEQSIFLTQLCTQ